MPKAKSTSTPDEPQPTTLKLNPDDLVEAILDGRVVEALANALSPFIKKSIDDSLNARLTPINKALQDLKQDNDRLKSQVVDLKKENADFKLQLAALTVEQKREYGDSKQQVLECKQQLGSHSGRMEAMEAYSRADNLIIKGLPEQTYAERSTPAADHDATGPTPVESHLAVESTFLSFCHDMLHVKVSPSDISIAHRMKAGPRDPVRPVIVRFTNRKARDAVYRARKCLKGAKDRIYISEHLTKGAADLFYESRKLLREKKIHSTWSQNGQIFIKRTADLSSKPALVKAVGELAAFRNGN